MATTFLDPASTSLIPDVCNAVETVPVVPVVPAKGSEFEGRIFAWVKTVFQSHPHLKGKADLVHCEFSNGRLQISGVLPSYYLKQLVQEALKLQCPDFLIENWIVVVDLPDEFPS